MNQAVARCDQECQREFAFTEADFERVRAMIRAHAGISLSEAKRDMVYSRLARLLRQGRFVSFTAYLDHVERGGPAEWEMFTNALTTNLTSFFREPHHFPILAEHLRAIRDRRATIWCCAASTGEEPYSIAITAVEVFGSFAPPVRVLATDVDTQVLRRAQAGIYPLERLEKMPQERIKRFFLKGIGTRAGLARIRPELQDMVIFRPLNLLDSSWPLRGPFDAIFCRNVMIYFDRPTQLAVLERFVPLLRPEGLLFVGHSESLHHAAHLFRPRGKTVYQLANGIRVDHG